MRHGSKMEKKKSNKQTMDVSTLSEKLPVTSFSKCSCNACWQKPALTQYAETNYSSLLTRIGDICHCVSLEGTLHASWTSRSYDPSPSNQRGKKNDWLRTKPHTKRFLVAHVPRGTLSIHCLSLSTLSKQNPCVQSWRARHTKRSLWRLFVSPGYS